MRRLFLLTLTLFGISAAAFGQGASSDPQTLQAILTEVRALRQELRVSLARVQPDFAFPAANAGRGRGASVGTSKRCSLQAL